MTKEIPSRVSDLIGRTPMMRLETLSPPDGASIYAKLEHLNPGGSVKNRIALSMIQEAEKSARLKPGMTIVEATTSSAVLSGKPRGPHAIEGIGAGFIPSILNRDVIDEIITVEDRDAFDMTESLAKEESLLVGISSGAAVLAARQVAGRLGPDQKVVTIIPDTGTRYFSIEEYFKKDQAAPESLLL